jgi:hypothetical protein
MKTAIDIAAGVLQRYRRYGWTQPAGEWGAIQTEVRAELRQLLEDGNAHNLAVYLAHMFQTPLYYGLVSMTGDLDDLPTQLTQRLALWTMLTENRDTTPLRASNAGSALAIQVGDVAMMYVTPSYS